MSTFGPRSDIWKICQIIMPLGLFEGLVSYIEQKTSECI